MLVLAIVVSTVLATMSIKADLPVTQLTAEQAANIQAKQDFAALHQSNGTALTRAELTVRESRYQEITQDNSLTLQERETQLNEIGYYTYDQGEVTNKITRSSTGDVYLQRVGIVYNGNNNTWILTAKGTWYAGSTWDSPFGYFTWPPKVGTEHNVGTSDTVGILLKNVSGDTKGLGIVGGYGLLGGGNRVDKYYNRSSLLTSSAQGALYGVRDYALITQSNIFGFKWTYIGNNFETQIIYNGNFANISGSAVMYYGHTWGGETWLESFGLDVAGTGFSISWHNKSGGFDIINPSDTIF
jgi:hypothetical protein